MRNGPLKVCRTQEHSGEKPSRTGSSGIPTGLQTLLALQTLGRSHQGELLQSFIKTTRETPLARLFPPTQKSPTPGRGWMRRHRSRVDSRHMRTPARTSESHTVMPKGRWGWFRQKNREHSCCKLLHSEHTQNRFSTQTGAAWQPVLS